MTRRFSLIAVLSLLFPSCASVFQPEPARGPWGETVKAIQIDRTGKQNVSDDAIRSYLKTQVNKPLLKEQIQADQRVLWKKLSLRSEVRYVLVEGGVKVIFRL